MVGALIAVGEGRMNSHNIYEMLTIPSKHSWNQAISPAPSYGLYLVNVEYSADTLVNINNTNQCNQCDNVDAD